MNTHKICKFYSSHVLKGIRASHPQLESYLRQLRENIEKNEIDALGEGWADNYFLGNIYFLIFRSTE